MQRGISARRLLVHFLAVLCLIMAADTLALFAGYNKIDPAQPLSYDLPLEELENLAAEHGKNPFEFVDSSRWWHLACGVAGALVALTFSLIVITRSKADRRTSFVATGMALGFWLFLWLGDLQYLFLSLIQWVTGDQNWYRSADMGFFALPERQISLSVLLLIGMSFFFFLLKARNTQTQHF